MSADLSRSTRMRMVRRLVGAAPLLVLCACSWFTDFKQQPKIDPWDTPADTIPPRGNPENSVSIYGDVAPGFMYARTGLDGLNALKAMSTIPNPTPPDSASVTRGRVLYQINCAVCHGPLGLGNGNATKYGIPAPAIGPHTKAADSLSDGYIFGMIRNGRGLMPTYNRIEESDRWDIVNYIRSLQGKLAIAADSSHGYPGETGSLVPGSTRTAPTRPVPYHHPGAPDPLSGARKDSTKGGI